MGNQRMRPVDNSCVASLEHEGIYLDPARPG